MTEFTVHMFVDGSVAVQAADNREAKNKARTQIERNARHGWADPTIVEAYSTGRNEYNVDVTMSNEVVVEADNESDALRMAEEENPPPIDVRPKTEALEVA